MESVDIAWGDVPTWLTMIATAAAVVAAIYAGRAAGKMLQLEQTRDQASRDSDRVQQATRIAAWAEPDPLVVGADLTIRRVSPRVQAIAVNRSDQPVYNVVIAWYQGADVLKTDAADLIPPGDERTWSLPEGEFDAVVGGDARELMRSSGTTALALSRLAAERLRIEIAFIDAQNRTWRRSPSGLLAEVTP